MTNVHIEGFPDVKSKHIQDCVSRITRAGLQFFVDTNTSATLTVKIGEQDDVVRPVNEQNSNEKSHEKPSASACNYAPKLPLFRFEDLIVPSSVLEHLQRATQLFELEHRVFTEWGLIAIEPFPRKVLNFHGEPGTGKTMAAHAIANAMGTNILEVSYSDVESKYHGEGPKNLDAVFNIAKEEGCVLFFDEADSLLSKRLANVTQGSEQAINSMRSQLLINLERFSGVVVFATNFVESYDRAFESRVTHVHFPLPDADCRSRLWEKLLIKELPTTSPIDPRRLAEKFDNICGRDIKNAVIRSAINAAFLRKDGINEAGLEESINAILCERTAATQPAPAQPQGEIPSEKQVKIREALERYETEQACT